MGRGRVEWDRFRYDVLGDPYLVWHDGPSFDVLLARCRSDPAATARLLRLGLQQHDPLAAMAADAVLAHGALATDLVPDLVAALEGGSDLATVETARALLIHTRRPEYSTPIIRVLLTGASWSDRMDAARALAVAEPTPVVVDALARGVTDEEYLVRYHAANSLLALAGAGTTIDEHEELFRRIAQQSSPEGWSQAAAELRRPWA